MFYAVGSQPRCVIVADFDGDLMPDVVALNVASSSVSLLRGNGDRTLDPHEVTAVGTVTPRGGWPGFPYPGRFMAAGDVDGDGDVDLAVPSLKRVKVLLNDGWGGFVPAGQHPAVGDPSGKTYGVELADVSNDGALDMCVAAVPATAPDLVATDVVEGGGWKASGRVWVLLGTGQGEFAPPVDYVLDGLLPMMADVGDIDDDGLLDAVATAGTFKTMGRLRVLMNDGSGRGCSERGGGDRRRVEAAERVRSAGVAPRGARPTRSAGRPSGTGRRRRG